MLRTVTSHPGCFLRKNDSTAVSERIGIAPSWLAEADNDVFIDEPFGDVLNVYST